MALRVVACQLNPTVGDIDGNVDAIVSAIDAHAAAGAQLIVFGELAVTGYPPEDLLLKPAFAAASDAGLQRVVDATARHAGVVAVVGAAEHVDPLHTYNTAVFCGDGKILGRHRKRLLPNYAVF